MSSIAPLLRMTNISKRFGATQALRGVSLTVDAGQVLALIGENGAGKSTLMKVLSGAHAPDSGEMELAGKRYRPSGPHNARASGVAMIYQELNLAPDLSVEDNIMLGRELHRGGVLNRRGQRQKVREALALLGHAELNPRAIAGRLSIGAQQLVEIARALTLDAKVIVFDEPTSSLPRRDVERLFATVAKLKQSGLGIVYISHFLEEVREVADRYAILRDGEDVAAGDLADTTDSQIVAAMVGRSVDELFPRTPHVVGPPVLSLAELSGARLPRNVSLELRRGEILGIAGLVGAGRTELLRCIFGLDRVKSGAVRVAAGGAALSPRFAIRAGLGLVSEDRKSEGLAQQLSIVDNMTLSNMAPISRFGWLNLSQRRAAAGRWSQRLSIRSRHLDQPVAALSGGNQQKVAIARVLHQDADVLLLDEPTRGVDLSTKAEIYRLIGELAASGKAIIFVSSYLPELLAICDTIGVMARGRLREIRPAHQWSEESVMACAIGSDL